MSGEKHSIMSGMLGDEPPPPASGDRAVAQSNIKKDERYDVRWEGMPFKYRKIGRGPKATYEKVCIMPLWLRNLWPTSDFDPCAVWEQASKGAIAQAQMGVRGTGEAKGCCGGDI